MNEKREKNYTLKSVQTEIKRIKKGLESKESELRKISAEIKSDKKVLRELEGIYTVLYQESLQKQIAAAWFKENKMTGEQINKFLELSTKISDKIDELDVADMVNAVNNVYNDHERESNTSEISNLAEVDSQDKVDTNINLSNTYQGGKYDNHN